MRPLDRVPDRLIYAVNAAWRPLHRHRDFVYGFVAVVVVVLAFSLLAAALNALLPTT